VWQIACYVAGLLALGNDAYDSMLFGREHSAEVNNGDMNVALTVNDRVGRAHSDFCSGSEVCARTAASAGEREPECNAAANPKEDIPTHPLAQGIRVQ
jgi:hypothetical protein